MIVKIVNVADKIKGNNLSPQKIGNWFDKNNILPYVPHNTFNIS